MPDTPKYPDVEVELFGQDGNAFAIISRVRHALRLADVPAEEIGDFINEAMCGDYTHVLQTVMATVTVS